MTGAPDEWRNDRGDPLLAAAVRALDGDTPRVVAAGKGALAEAILRAASEANIPVTRDRAMATILAALKDDSPIPPAIWPALIEILLALYHLDAGRPPGPEAAGENIT